jgi:hypothetical protein
MQLGAPRVEPGPLKLESRMAVPARAPAVEPLAPTRYQVLRGAVRGAAWLKDRGFDIRGLRFPGAAPRRRPDEDLRGTGGPLPIAARW